MHLTTPTAAAVEATQPTCKNGPLCRVCRMGPGIAKQYDDEAKGLEQRGHLHSAVLHRQRAEFWRRQVARCQEGVL